MLQNIKSVIFDLDGTLVDSMWIWKDIDIEYLGQYGYSLPESLQKEIEGMSFTETAYYFKGKFGIPESVETIKETWNRMAYQKYVKEVPLKKGVLPFLSKCRKLGLKMGIASSNSIELIKGVLHAHQIENYFDDIKTACEVNAGKPSPDIYLAASKELLVDPKDCLVFEDVPMGIKAGKSANMTVCAVHDRYSEDQEKDKRKLADYYIRSYEDVLEGTFEVLLHE